MNKARTVLRGADLYGVDVAKLNINGKTEFNTTFGGVVSIFLRVFVVWFSIINLRKLISKQDATLSEVSQSLDLGEAPIPVYNAAHYHLSIGYGAYYVKTTEVCDSLGLNCI
jgi:hypothetical protein